MTAYLIEQLPIVPPMFVRRFAFNGLAFPCKGGLACVKEVSCEDVGMADTRLDYDEDVVDCSYAIFDLTNQLVLINDAAQEQQPGLRMHVAYFNARRWRSHRINNELQWPETTLLYIGNPVRIDAGLEGIAVYRSSEFLIRSGVELQAIDNCR